ncbi:hypothetical protein MTO96_035291 [Rhipicephalus appendiculatus]
MKRHHSGSSRYTENPKTLSRQRAPPVRRPSGRFSRTARGAPGVSVAHETLGALGCIDPCFPPAIQALLSGSRPVELRSSGSDQRSQRLNGAPARLQRHLLCLQDRTRCESGFATAMPFLKIWSADHKVKKTASATTLSEVLAEAKEKGVCDSANAKEGTSISERLPCTPTIVALGTIFRKECIVACEQEITFTEAVDFAEATCLLLLSYYVFNMAYADPVGTTLEFLQTEMFDGNPTRGSKCANGRKSRTSVDSKIMKLIQRLR